MSRILYNTYTLNNSAMKTNPHILIVRTSSLVIDFKSYNCQETGLATALTKKGYKVSFITPGNKAGREIIPVSDNKYIYVYTLTLSKLNRNICWYHGYFKLLKTLNPDLIHINSISLSMSFFSLLWAKYKKKKSVVIQGNYETTHKPLLRNLEQLFNKTIGKYIINNTNGIGCKTKWASDFIKSYSNNIETNITKIGLDVSRFANYNKIDWRAKLNIKDKHILLYVGAIESRRNPLFLIDLLYKLPENYCLVMVGDGQQKDDVVSKLKNYRIESRCKLLGKLPQTDLPSLYEAADIFLLASDYEIYGMVILESMYFGTPVISTLTAGSDTIISNGIDGIILNTLDVDRWKNEVINLTENPQKLLTISISAKQKIENNLIWDKTVDEFITLYNKAFNDDK